MGARTLSPARQALSAEDRSFFAQVGRVIFMNPFAEEREEILARLTAGIATKGGEALVNVVLPEMNARLARLDNKGFDSVQRFVPEDRELMRPLFLYQVYHRHVPGLSKLIENQLRSKDATVPFAEQLLAELMARGLTEIEALHYLAIFFQLRRAFHFIVMPLAGRSPSMRQLRLALWNNVFTNDMRAYDQHLWGRMEDFSTLLLGETGTGKGSAAAAIGRSGYIPFDRAKGRFVVSFTESFIATNLSQFPETLIESELFGHRKGAFTGAVDDHKGLLEMCSRHGALFLDEIGDASVPVQIKLLEVLQERTFTPVGSHEQKRFAGRVIAATNKSVAELRASGKFREDFFYRLCSDVITVPTLRQRIDEDPSELERLVSLVVARLTGEQNPRLTELTLETFKRDLPKKYPWPGNVRELEQAVRRVLLTHHYTGELRAPGSDPDAALSRDLHAGTLDARQLLSRYCALLYDRFGTLEEVARRTGLDRRTVKKYLHSETPGSGVGQARSG